MLTEQEKIHTEETSEVQVHKCHICDKTFSGKSGQQCLKRHLKTHSDVKEFLCDQCDYTTNIHFSLKIHKLNHTGKPYQCEKCAKAFPTQGVLNKHLVVHSDKRSFQCDLCGEDFKRSSVLQRHKQLIHNINNKIQSHKCDECDESFSSKASLIIHKGKHKKIADFLCDTCSKPFFDHISLNIHRYTHKDKKFKFKCSECSKKFMEEKSFVRHQKEYHQTGKDFICQHCETLLPTKYKLQVHMQKHKEKSYVCNICQKSFNRKGNLKVHTLIHSGETPFKCTECYQGFRELFSMKKHMLSIHRIEYKPPNSPICSGPPEVSDPFMKKYYLEPPIQTPSLPKNMLEPSSCDSRITPHLTHDELEGLSYLDSAITHKFNLNIPSYSEALSGKEKHYIQPPIPTLSPPQKMLEPSSNSSRSTPHLTPDELEDLPSLDSPITHKSNLNIPSKSETLSVKQFLTSTIPCARESLFSKLDEDTNDNKKDSVLSEDSKEDIVLNIKVENIDAESIECNENAIDNENIKIEPVEVYEETAKIENTTTDEAKVKIEKPSDIYMDSHLFKKEIFYNDCDKMSNDTDEAIKANKKIIKISNEEHLYACNQCEYTSKMNSNINKHIRQVHNKERPFMCDLCSKTYQTKTILRDHKELVHEKKEIMCDDCGRTFFSKISLGRHKRTVHNNEKPFMCDLCSKTYKNKISLRDHIELVHEKKEIVCDDCGRTFFSKIRLRVHKRNFHVNVTNEFMCDDCGKPFLTNTKLRRHKKNVHSDNPGKNEDNPGKNKRHNTCDECGKIFTTPEHLKRHKMVHSGTENYNNDYVEDLKDRKVSNSISCDECDRKFPCKSKLNYHVQVDHLGILPYACDQCDKKYKYNISLKNHKLVHSGLATFNCDHCTEKFISKATLARHLNESHNIQTYNQKYNQTIKRIRPKTQMCQLCSKWFRGIAELKRHEVVHTGERNHICHICNKAFSQQKQLKEHIYQHLAGNLDSSGSQIYK